MVALFFSQMGEQLNWLCNVISQFMSFLNAQWGKDSIKVSGAG